MQHSRVVVTGGAGFIGSHVARALLTAGHDVAIVDDLSTGRQHNIPDNARFIAGSILDDSILDSALADSRAVFHHAAQVSVAASVEDPRTTFRLNIEGMERILEGARRHDVDKVIFASTSSIYGDIPSGQAAQESLPAAPKSPYALSKSVGEQLGKLYHGLYDIGFVSLRYFNVYGPRQDPGGPYAAVIPRFLIAGLSGKSLPVNGDGGQTRDFVYVNDVAQANLDAWTSSVRDGSAFNIASGQSCSILSLAERIAAPSGQIVHLPDRLGDIRHSICDISRARQALAFESRTDIATGLALTRDWFAGGWRSTGRSTTRIASDATSGP